MKSSLSISKDPIESSYQPMTKWTAFLLINGIFLVLNGLFYTQMNRMLFIGLILIWLFCQLFNIYRRLDLIEVEDGISGTLIRMQEFQTDFSAQQKGIRALKTILQAKHIGSMKSSIKQLIENDGILILLNSAIKYSQEPSHTHEICQLFQFLFQQSIEFRSKFILESELFQKFLSFLACFTSSPSILSKLFGLYGHLMDEEIEPIKIIQLRFQRHYFNKNLWKILKMYPNEEQVQQWGLWVTLRLIQGTPISNLSIHQETIEEKGLEHMHLMMKTHKKHVWIQRICCLWLGKCFLDFQSISPENSAHKTMITIRQMMLSIVLHLKFPQAIHYAMVHFPNEPEIQSIGSTLIYQFSKDNPDQLD